MSSVFEEFVGVYKLDRIGAADKHNENVEAIEQLMISQTALLETVAGIRDEYIALFSKRLERLEKEVFDDSDKPARLDLH